MHAVARPLAPREISMYPEDVTVSGWTVIREPRHHSTSEDSHSEEGDMDVDRRDYQQQRQHGQQWYSGRDDVRYRESQYTLPPLSSSSRRSPTLPVHLSLPIPSSLPFPSSKSPVSAPPHAADPQSHHTLLPPYHPASAHPLHSHEYDHNRDFGGRHHNTLPPLDPYRDLPPISPADDQHPHSAHPKSASLSVSSLLSSKPSPVPPPSLPSAARHPSAHRHSISHRGPDPPLDPQGQKQIIYTDDATTKLGSYIRRRCYNCHTPDSAAWRRSGMHPGKVLCNKCGLYERTHQKDRPHDPAELRSKPRKTLHQKLAGPGVPSSPVEGMSRTRLSPVDRSGTHRTSPVDNKAVSPLDSVPPRPLNTHASLLQMQAQNQSQNQHAQTALQPASVDETMRDDSRQQHHTGYGYQHKDGASRAASGHPHSLGSLLNHPSSPSQHTSPDSPHSQPRESPRSNTKDLHLSPPHLPPIYPHHTRNGTGSSGSSPRSVASAIDVDRKEYRYGDDRRASPSGVALENDGRHRVRDDGT